MQKFLIEMFDNVRPDGSSMKFNGFSYFMTATATDTENIRRMFTEVRDANSRELLKRYELL